MNDKFIFIGDSLTFGYGVPKSQCWVTRLQDFLQLDTVNKGLNGDTTPSMLNRFYEDVILLNPQYVFLMGGTNDLLCGRSISSIIGNLEEIILESQKYNITIFVGIPPYIVKEMAKKLFIPSPFYDYCELNISKLRTLIIDLCIKYSITYIDFYNATLKNINKSIYIDGIHLNFLGNTLLLNEAKNVLSFLS